MSRRADIELLLSSLNDHLPALGSSVRPTSGLAANARKPCPDCGHSDTPGWRVDSFKRRAPCLACGGRIEPRQKRGKGTVAFDPYDVLERPIQTATQSAPPTRAPRVVGCDACGGSGVGKPHLDEDGREYRDACERCDGSGRRVVVSFSMRVDDLWRDESVDKVTAAVDRRTLAGSYHELDQALACLPGKWRKVVYDVHVNRLLEPEELCDVEAARLGVAMLVLDGAMPAVVRVPGAVRANARQRREWALKVKRTRGLAAAARDKEIRKLVRQGKPVQWVASEYGLGVRQVYRLVKGEAAA